MHSQRVFLTGFMGSGKSTVGGKLAQRLGYKFIDLDDVVEETIGISIAEIFSTFGEATFRDIERHALEWSTTQKQSVIALGGGAIVNQGALQLVNSSGQSVYLKVNVEVLVERLRQVKNRPLLFDEKDLESYVENLLAHRRHYYESAHHVVEASNRAVNALVEEIADRLGDF